MQTALAVLWTISLSMLITGGKAECLDCRPAQNDLPQTSSFVCKCTADYCDTLPRMEELRNGEYAVYSSSKDGDRFRTSRFLFENEAEYKSKFSLNDSLEYQTIYGFGGSFTDAATININSLSPSTRQKLLQSYFSAEGIEYTMGRVPIHSCDFSTHIYSYDDTPGDFCLKNFRLAPEDINHKIRVIGDATALIPDAKLKLIVSPWSAPAWMREKKNMTASGGLIGKPGGKYYKTWAQYFVRFLEEYKKQGVPIWGLTVQNEPSAATLPSFLYSWQRMAMPPQIAREFVKQDLGPALHNAGFGDIKLMSHDDQVPWVYGTSQVVYSDKEAAAYLSGISIHWYQTRSPDDYEMLDLTHQAFPDQFLLSTEACEGYEFGEDPVKLGDWERGESYSLDIIQDLNHWVTGWIDWNLALDMKGGPNWAHNEVDSPIIVDVDRDAFYKQPMYYHMGHFSKFVSPGSKRIGLQASQRQDLYSIAFKRPDNSKVVILLNVNDNEAHVTIHDADQGYINTRVAPRSIRTYIW